MILGPAHRLTGALGDGPPRWGALSCPTRGGAANDTGKVRLREPPKCAQGCCLWLSSSWGASSKQRYPQSGYHAAHSQASRVDKLSVKPQPRSQDAHARSHCQSIMASSDCCSPSPARWKLLACVPITLLGKPSVSCLVCSCHIHLVPATKQNKTDMGSLSLMAPG